MSKELKCTKARLQQSIYDLISELKTTVDAIWKDSADPEFEIEQAIDNLENGLIKLLDEDLFTPKGAIAVMDSLDGQDEINEVADYFDLTTKKRAADKLRSEGYLLIKPEGIEDAEKIKEFLRQNIYPYNVNFKSGEEL